MSGHLLILLVPVLSLCGATEYYVRPTEPTNTSCPAQPCLTLNQYTSDSDHYFKPNTVFKFLPGTHHMDRPLTIKHVHNMSLESLSDENKHPHLVAQFSCEHECIHVYNTTTAYNGQHGIVLEAMNNTHITNTTVTQNSGIGIFLSEMNNNTYMTKTTATHNGRFPLHIGDFHGQIVILSSINTLIYNTSFTVVSAQSLYSTSTTYPNSPPAVIVLYQSTLLVSECDFTRNNISALAAYASNITVSGGLTFSNNTAFAGTAFMLVKDSILVSAGNSHMYFLNNHATNVGGVIYIGSNSIYLVKVDGILFPRSTCFLNIEGNRFQSRFTFANNSAGIGGDILLYGRQVALSAVDWEWNCLESFKNISNMSQNGLSLISSDPLRVCLCNGTGQPDCPVIVDPIPRTVYPGQIINISAVVVGQDFGTVAGSAYAQFLQGGYLPQLKPEQKVQSVTQHNCSNLSYTIFSQGEVSEAVLVLIAQDSYVSQFFDNAVDEDTIDTVREDYSVSNERAVETLLYSTNFPVYVNVSILPCPPGFMLTTNILLVSCSLLVLNIF